ncbi:MAG: hypothetical protein AAB403_00635 [Planctomycetota bacterium]
MTDPVIEPREAENSARLKALRDAVQVGIDDLNSGRYKSFESFADLDAHLGKITDRAIARHRAGQKRK